MERMGGPDPGPCQLRAASVPSHVCRDASAQYVGGVAQPM
jgi:hypothetical protein